MHELWRSSPYFVIRPRRQTSFNYTRAVTPVTYGVGVKQRKSIPGGREHWRLPKKCVDKRFRVIDYMILHGYAIKWKNEPAMGRMEPQPAERSSHSIYYGIIHTMHSFICYLASVLHTTFGPRCQCRLSHINNVHSQNLG